MRTTLFVAILLVIASMAMASAPAGMVDGNEQMAAPTSQPSTPQPSSVTVVAPVERVPYRAMTADEAEELRCFLAKVWPWMSKTEEGRINYRCLEAGMPQLIRSGKLDAGKQTAGRLYLNPQFVTNYIRMIQDIWGEQRAKQFVSITLPVTPAYCPPTLNRVARNMVEVKVPSAKFSCSAEKPVAAPAMTGGSVARLRVAGSETERVIGSVSWWATTEHRQRCKREKHDETCDPYPDGDHDHDGDGHPDQPPPCAS